MIATSINFGESIIYDGEQELVKLIPNKKFSMLADLHFKEDIIYEVKKLNLAKTKLGVFVNDSLLAKIRYRYSGWMDIEYMLQGERQLLTFRQNYNMKTRFALFDNDKKKIISGDLKAYNKGLKIKGELHMELSDSLQERSDWLPITALFTYMVRYMIRRSGHLVAPF